MKEGTPAPRRTSRAAVALTCLMLAILATPSAVWLYLAARENAWRADVEDALGRLADRDAGSREAVRRISTAVKSNPGRRTFSVRWQVADASVLHGPPPLVTFQIDYDRHAACLREWRHRDTLHPLNYLPVPEAALHAVAVRRGLPRDFGAFGAKSTYYGPMNAFSHHR